MRRITSRVPTAISLLALFLALGGTAFAAKHYLITSTKQIKPSVLKALKGKAGAAGAKGEPGAKGEGGPKGEIGTRGEIGPAGSKGETGTKGEPGLKGEAGKDGAVAGYSATQSTKLDITSDASLTAVPGLTKSLPAGSFIVTASVEIYANGLIAHSGEYAGAECALTDKLSGGTEKAAVGEWASALHTAFGTALAIGEIPLELAVATGEETSTLTVSCREGGHGEGVTIEAKYGSIVATQTSENK